MNRRKVTATKGGIPKEVSYPANRLMLWHFMKTEIIENETIIKMKMTDSE